MTSFFFFFVVSFTNRFFRALHAEALTEMSASWSSVDFDDDVNGTSAVTAVQTQIRTVVRIEGGNSLLWLECFLFVRIEGSDSDILLCLSALSQATALSGLSVLSIFSHCSLFETAFSGLSVLSLKQPPLA